MKPTIQLATITFIMTFCFGCVTSEPAVKVDPGPFPSNYEQVLRSSADTIKIQGDILSIHPPVESQDPAGWEVLVKAFTPNGNIGGTMRTYLVTIRDGKPIKNELISTITGFNIDFK